MTNEINILVVSISIITTIINVCILLIVIKGKKNAGK